MGKPVSLVLNPGLYALSSMHQFFSKKEDGVTRWLVLPLNLGKNNESLRVCLKGEEKDGLPNV